MGDGTCSVPTRSRGIHGMRSWNCGSSARVLGVLTGAIGVLASSPRRTHSAVVRERKRSASSRRSSSFPRAWSAYCEPGWRSKRSARSTALQKFSQNSRSEAMKRMWPSAVS
jgi:hypothetical protein